MAYLDENGLSHLWDKLKLAFAPISSVVSAYTSSPSMDGTASAGFSANYSRGDHVHPSDTSRAPTSHASSSTTYGKGTGSNYGHVKLSDATDSTTAASSGGTAATPKAVKDALDAAKAYADAIVESGGGEVNQNAFSNVAVKDYSGSSTSTIAADSKTDTLTIQEGSNIQFTADTSNDKLTIAAKNVYDSATSRTANYVLAAPNGSNGAATFRALVAADLPTVNRAYSDEDGNNIKTTYAKKTDIAGMYNFKGSVATASALPASGQSVGDVYNIEAASSYGAAGANVAWTGTAWDSLGEIFQISAISNAEIDTICV